MVRFNQKWSPSKISWENVQGEKRWRAHEWNAGDVGIHVAADYAPSPRRLYTLYITVSTSRALGCIFTLAERGSWPRIAAGLQPTRLETRSLQLNSALQRLVPHDPFIYLNFSLPRPPPSTYLSLRIPCEAPRHGGGCNYKFRGETKSCQIPPQTPSSCRPLSRLVLFYHPPPHTVPKLTIKR